MAADDAVTMTVGGGVTLAGGATLTGVTMTVAVVTSASGALQPGVHDTIAEGTGGNTGIGLALVAAVKAWLQHSCLFPCNDLYPPPVLLYPADLLYSFALVFSLVAFRLFIANRQLFECTVVQRCALLSTQWLGYKCTAEYSVVALLGLQVHLRYA